MKNLENFEGKVAVVTGAAQGIGKCIAEEFRSRGAKVAIIDIQANDYFVGDLAKKSDIEAFAEKVLRDFGKVDFLVNNAIPPMIGVDDCSFEDFCRAQRIGVVAPFYLVKLFKNFMPAGSAIVNISSTRERQSQPQSESYAAAKGGIGALTHALAVSLGPKIRVNAISPGWIHNAGTPIAGNDAAQQPVGRVGNPQDIAQMVIFLCSEKSGFITGENITIDGGMSRLMIYHNDRGWRLD